MCGRADGVSEGEEDEGVVHPGGRVEQRRRVSALKMGGGGAGAVYDDTKTGLE